MGKNLYIFNFDNIPRGLVWMIILFIILEIATRMVWNPNLIGERIYGRFDPSYNYGYDSERPIFFKKDNEYVCYPTQYLDVYKQTLNYIKQNNEFRIFTFGGSVSKGEEKGNYLYFLENLLNAKYPYRQFKIINFSASGYGTSRMLILLNKVIKFKPDLLIWHIHGSNEYEDERDFKYHEEVNSGLNRLIFRSYFLVILKKIYSYLINFDDGIVQDSGIEIEMSRKTTNLQRWLAQIDQNLSCVVEIVEKIKIPLFLIGRTEKKFGISEFETQRVISINNTIKKHIKENVFYIDTPMIMQKIYPNETSRKAIFIDSSHWTDQAHEVFAGEVFHDFANFLRLKQNLY